MDEDIDTFESLSAEFEVQGFGVPRPSVLWLAMKYIRLSSVTIIMDYKM